MINERHSITCNRKHGIEKVAIFHLLTQLGHDLPGLLLHANSFSQVSFSEASRHLLLPFVDGTDLAACQWPCPAKNSYTTRSKHQTYMISRVLGSLDIFVEMSAWPRFACELEDHEVDAGEEAGLLNEEQSLLVSSRLHQVLRPLMLRRLKQTVASELPSKVSSVLCLVLMFACRCPE